MTSVPKMVWRHLLNGEVILRRYKLTVGVAELATQNQALKLKALHKGNDLSFSWKHLLMMIPKDQKSYLHPSVSWLLYRDCLSKKEMPRLDELCIP